MPVLGPLIGAAGAIGGGLLANRGQDRAADASQAATQASIAEQRRQYNQSRQDQLPWLNTGSAAVTQLGNLSGLGSIAERNAAFQKFQVSPDYQFRLNEGNRSLNARNAALGIQDSGAAQKAALKYGQGQASAEFGTWANRLAALAGVGQQAAGQTAQLGQGYANAFTNIQGQNAQNLGSSYTAQGNQNANTFGNLAGIGSSLFQNYGSNLFGGNQATGPGGGLWGLY